MDTLLARKEIMSVLGSVYQKSKLRLPLLSSTNFENRSKEIWLEYGNFLQKMF